MSHTIQAALPVRPAVLMVIALHAALVVALAMNFRYIDREKELPDPQLVPVAPEEVDPRPAPDRNALGPVTFDPVTPVPTEPDVPVDPSAADSTQLAQQPLANAMGPSTPSIWSRPQIVDQTDIPYPAERGVKPEGTVRLRLLIGIDGRPLQIVLGVSSGHPALDRAALNAVAHWRFKPRLRNGQPVESWAEMPIVFRLEN